MKKHLWQRCSHCFEKFTARDEVRLRNIVDGTHLTQGPTGDYICISREDLHKYFNWNSEFKAWEER